jgi:thymidine kinase
MKIMELILILGPMKSGKSFDLISRFASLQYAEIPFKIFQPEKNTRDQSVWSRNGVSLGAEKISDLRAIKKEELKVAGIDEIHMFNDEDAYIIEEMLKRGIKVIASGLDTDYKGEMFPVIKRLLSMGPKHVEFKRAVCEICKNPDAVYTQVYKNNEPILTGIPSIIPEDGSYVYKPVCRNCFLRK